MSASSKAVGVLSSDGRVGRFEPLINVVKRNRPKLLSGLNQNGMQRDNSLRLWVTRTRTLPADRRDLNHPWLYDRICQVERGNLVHSPILIAQGAGSMGKPIVSEAYGCAGRSKSQKRRPLCNGVDRGSNFAPRESGLTDE